MSETTRSGTGNQRVLVTGSAGFSSTVTSSSTGSQARM